jgi:sulfofructose kinase
VAKGFHQCGGGPAANAAVAVSRLGLTAAFYGYLGCDPFGDLHLQELNAEHVGTSLICRGNTRTPVSAVVVKPDGQRTLVNYNAHRGLRELHPDFWGHCRPAVILFDGWEPDIALQLLQQTRQRAIPTVLDAGSVHHGTRVLAPLVDYLVCSEKFARDYADVQIAEQALPCLHELADKVVVTCGQDGLLWQNGDQRGKMPAFSVAAVDTTGAGDAFHGAFAAGLCKRLTWNALLRYASAVAALCCTKNGARNGLPWKSEVETFLAQKPV